MEISIGNRGWVCVKDDELPGELYVRVEPDERGRLRVHDLYLQGGWRPIVGADLRELNLQALEEIIQSIEVDERAVSKRIGVPGPELHTLASSFATTYGSVVYGGRDCDCCGAPLKWARKPGNVDEHWTNDWVALSYFAQLPQTDIHNPKPRSSRPGAVMSPAKRGPRLQRPTEGLTDEFLGQVRDAYVQALLDGKHPAPELARQLGEPKAVRTIHKWVSVARQRGIMPPASQRGRVV